MKTKEDATGHQHEIITMADGTLVVQAEYDAAHQLHTHSAYCDEGRIWLASACGHTHLVEAA